MLISKVYLRPKEGDKMNRLESAKIKVVEKVKNKIQTIRNGGQGKTIEKELMDNTLNSLIKSEGKRDTQKGSIRAKKEVKDVLANSEEKRLGARDPTDISTSQSDKQLDGSKEAYDSGVDKDIDQSKVVDPGDTTQNIQGNQENPHQNQEEKPIDRALESNVEKDHVQDQADHKAHLVLPEEEVFEEANNHEGGAEVGVVKDHGEGAGVEVVKHLEEGAGVEVVKHVEEGAGEAPKDIKIKAEGESKDLKQSVGEDQEATFKLVEINGDKPTTGVIVLGMRHTQHSPKSILSGMLVEGYKYYTGGPLMRPASKGERESYELIPSILQNDSLMFSQNLDWTGAIERYDSVLVKQDIKNGKVQADMLAQVANTLNDPKHVPWLLTDSRLCFTITDWLPYLNSKPAVLFTWRSPLDVVRDMHKTDDSLTMVDGMKTWMKFSKAAVENSADLCRVYSGYDAILENPLHEIKRIQDQLHRKCGVPNAKAQITEEMVNDFIDPSLQHQKMEREKKMLGVPVIEVFPGNCRVYHAGSLLDPEDGIHRYEEKKFYLQAMKIFCDFESREAFKEDYKWPDF